MNTILRITTLYSFAAILALVAFLGLLEGSTPTESYDSITDLFFLLLGFAFTTVLILMIIKLYSGDLLFRVIDFLIITTASLIVYYGFASLFNFPEWLALLLALFTGLIKQLKQHVRNITAIISSAGVAAMFGLYFNLLQLILFAVLMAIYDYAAVFITRHMVKFATVFSRKNMSLSVSAVHRDHNTGQTEFLELGTGDIIIPISLALAVFKESYLLGVGSYALLSYFLMVLYLLLGLTATLLAVQKKRLFLPALPPLIGTALIGYISLVLAHII